MSAKVVCQNFFNDALNIHRARANVLFDVAWGLVNGAKLTCTALGREIQRTTDEKHRIKAVDRLLNNQHLIKETPQIYKELTSRLLKSLPELFILVDWSGCSSSEYHMLRASIAYEGRSITLYNEIHPKAVMGNRQVHKQFLKQLKSIVPLKSKVTIVTDAGFATPWFDAVQKLNWDFVGRINRNVHILLDEDDKHSWIDTTELGCQATSTPKYKATGKIGKKSSTPVEVHVYVYKKAYKGRKGLSRFPDNNKQHSKANRTPWVIATSLCRTEYKARQIINIYKKRMQIEQNFRDDKNVQYGFGHRLSGTKNPLRMQILFLIAAIAAFFLWWIGLVAESQALQYKYQANTIKHRRVLSLNFLAKAIVRDDKYHFKQANFSDVAQQFSKNYLREILC